MVLGVSVIWVVTVGVLVLLTDERLERLVDELPGVGVVPNFGDVVDSPGVNMDVFEVELVQVSEATGGETVVGSVDVQGKVPFPVWPGQVRVLLPWAVITGIVDRGPVTDTVMLTVSVSVTKLVLQFEVIQWPNPVAFGGQPPPPLWLPRTVTVVLTMTTLGEVGTVVVVALLGELKSEEEPVRLLNQR